MSVDFPRAWEIARAVPAEKHSAACSFAVTKGGLLCDCDVLWKHAEVTDEILQTVGGKPFHKVTT